MTTIDITHLLPFFTDKQIVELYNSFEDKLCRFDCADIAIRQVLSVRQPTHEERQRMHYLRSEALSVHGQLTQLHRERQRRNI